MNFFRTGLACLVGSFCALTSIPAQAGDKFVFKVVTSDSPQPSSSYYLEDLDYNDWYIDDITNSMQPGFEVYNYTEECNAFFSCGKARGDRSLNAHGIEFTLYKSEKATADAAAQFCLSWKVPLRDLPNSCGHDGHPIIVVDQWLAGCVVPGEGYRCAVNITRLSETQKDDVAAKYKKQHGEKAIPDLPDYEFDLTINRVPPSH